MASAQTYPITVRTANLNDLPVLLEFEQQIILAERPFDSTLKNGHINYYDIGQMILSPDVEVVAAECNGELVGSGYARIEDAKPYLKHPKHAYLGFMYTKPEHRGKGVNKMVIEKLQEWALAKNVAEFRLEVYHNNAPAVRAYEKIGFAPLLVLMRVGITTKNP